MSEIWKIVLTSCLTILVGVIVLVIGQIIQRFVIEPYHEFKKEIGNVRDALFFYAHIYCNAGTPGEKYTFPAERELRRLAGTLRTSLHAVNWYEFLLRLGLVPPKQDVIEVSKNLVGLANCLTESKYNDANIRRDQTIRKLLGFPDTD